MSDIAIVKPGVENIEYVDFTEEQRVAHEAKVAEDAARAAATEYARNRQMEYPSVQDQLDMQYWDSVNGTTIWADTIAAIKAAHPKPEA